MSILNGNDYQRGWQDGRTDAIASRDKTYIRMGMSWKFPIHGNLTLDSYNQGYDDGYAIGLREKNVVQKVEINNNNIEMGTSEQTLQNYERELRAIEQLNNMLVSEVCDRIMMINARMKGYIFKLVDTGVALQACKEYRDKYYAIDAQLFQRLYERIVSADLPRIHVYYGMIASQLEQATGQHVTYTLRTPSSSSNSVVPREAVERNGGVSDLEIQSDATASFMTYLVNERDEMLYTLKDYQDRCNDMIAAGVPRQIINDYVANYVPENVQNIKNIISQLQSNDYPYLEKIFRTTVQSILDLGGNVSMSPKSM